MALAGVELILSTIYNATLSLADYGYQIKDITTQEKYFIEISELKKIINGKHLRIGTYNSYPLSYTVPGPNGTLIGKGVAFVLVDILQENFNFTYDVVVPRTNHEFGGQSPEDSLVGMLCASQIDMAAAFLPKLLDYYGTIEYSSDLDEGLWMMMMKRPKASATGSGVAAPFNQLVWYLILTVVLTYGPCVTLLTYIRAKMIPDEERHLSLTSSFWFVYSVFVKQGTSLSPEANMTRILFATWWLYTILLSAFYTANLTAFLTLSKFTLEVESPKDLYNKNYRWMSTAGGAVQYAIKSVSEGLSYLNKMVASGQAEFRNLPSRKQYLAYVDEGGVYIKQMISLQHIIYKDYKEKRRNGVPEGERCTYAVANNPFMRIQRAFAYPLKSPLTALFNTVLMYIQQAGLIRFLTYEKLPTSRICPLNLQSKERQLKNADLIVTYLLIATGLSAAVVIFIVEMISRRYLFRSSRVGHRQGEPKRRNRASRRRETSRPPAYDSLFGRTKYKINETTKTKIVNGREYYVVVTPSGATRLIPVRTPSALLFRR